jgi:hypothetical protein
MRDPVLRYSIWDRRCGYDILINSQRLEAITLTETSTILLRIDPGPSADSGDLDDLAV